MTGIPREHLHVGRVLQEDERFMILEVIKDNDYMLHLDSDPANNRFFTLIFTRRGEDGAMQTWVPWDS